MTFLFVNIDSFKISFFFYAIVDFFPELFTLLFILIRQYWLFHGRFKFLYSKDVLDLFDGFLWNCVSFCSFSYSIFDVSSCTAPYLFYHFVFHIFVKLF